MPPREHTEAPARIRIERPEPMIDCGRSPAKRTVGDLVEVSADIFRDGHEIMRAAVRYRGPGEEEWREAPMERIDAHLAGDRWAGRFQVDRMGRWEYGIQAWTDPFASWRDELQRKLAAGQHDLAGELSEGELLIAEAAERAEGPDRSLIEHALRSLRGDIPVEAKHDAALGGELFGAIERCSPRHEPVSLPDRLELDVDRERARFGAWYELFPRSWGGFLGVARVMPQLAELGFDVVYLPPVHPIGETNRKGANNTLTAGPNDPGSPWAIGLDGVGGHDAVHPELGTMEDFDRMVTAAREAGVEIALDFAIQCSADHPWLREHPEWFHRRPDGTLKYAENPPKRYQDIYNVNWQSEDWRGLWQALLDVVRHWVDHGVRIFRVDNPHTKPLPFWEWLIGEIRAEHPDVIFLAEAFTRRVMMRGLAKLGFGQSYTYFTWKNSRWELTEYVSELAYSGEQEYFRPNFFANTPDILHAYLQHGGRPAFEARLVLAATLSPTYGIYSGFERCENVPVREGSEEYLDSEKYEAKQRSVDGVLLPLIKRVNAARRENPALQHLSNITFLETENDALIAYLKRTGDNVVVCVVNLDPHQAQEGLTVIPAHVGLPPVFPVSDLLDGQRYEWRIGRNYVGLEPGVRQAHIFRVEPW